MLLSLYRSKDSFKRALTDSEMVIEDILAKYKKISYVFAAS